MTTVLADMHHGDLYESLRILFEDRLGWELYRPIGLDWFHEGYWKVWPHPNTAGQYLGIHLTSSPKTVDDELVADVHGKYAWLNRFVEDEADGLYVVRDHNHGGRMHKAITFDRAKREGFDFVLSSISQHWEPYERFRKEFCPPHAKHIHQIGNIGQMPPRGADNVLCSTMAVLPDNLHSVRYHQEFDLNEFSFVPIYNPRVLTNLMHYQENHYWSDFNVLASELRKFGWTVRDHGAGNKDGPVENLADAIQQSGWIWHCKKGGDGYGHNIHNTFACGRPMVVRGSQYRGTWGGELFRDMSTVIDVDSHQVYKTASLLEAAVQSYDVWTDAVRAAFSEVVNFDREADEIKVFLENLR